MTGLRVSHFLPSMSGRSRPSPEGSALIAALLAEPSLRQELDETARSELRALDGESDPQLFFEGLLAFASRLEQDERLAAASTVYTAAAGAAPDQAQQARARTRLDAILGRGALGPRAEFLLRRLAREASSPAMLVGMAGAQAVFGATRLALLSRLAASPNTNLLTRGFGARALASAGAFALEAPAFTAFTRGAHALLGHSQDWSAPTLGRELASGYLTLGALKVTHWGASALLGAGDGLRAAVATEGPLASRLLPQASALAGIYLGHALEVRLGLRPHQDGATALVDSLAMLLQFHVGGRLAGQAFPRLASFERALQTRGEAMARPRSDAENFPGDFFGTFALNPAPALGVRSRAADREGHDLRLPTQVWMSVQFPGEGHGPRLPTRGPRNGASPPPLSPMPRPAEAHGEAPTLLTFSFPTLPETCRCLVVEYRGEVGGNGSRHLESLLQRLRTGLARSPHLEELRLRFPDGSVHFFHRGNGPSLHETREGPEQARALESWNPYPPERVRSLQVVAPWSPVKDPPSLPEWLGALRRAAGLTQPQVAARIQALTGEAKDYNAVSRYERDHSAGISFRTLRALGEIYGVDVRNLIQASNRSRFPDIPEVQWTTRDYPIYLENAADLQRIRHFARRDPGRESFGWLVYAARKNPFHYRSTVDLRRETGLNSNAFSRLEQERNAPSLRAIQGLSRSLNLPEGELIRRANRSFFPELGVETLFPGRDVFVDPLADDPRKLRAYLAAPGSLGQLFFGYRKSLPDRPGAVEMSRRLGRHENYWGEREMNKIPVERGNWRDWYDLFQRTGLPFDPIQPFLGAEAGAERSASVLFHEALRGEALKTFAERTGFDRKGLSLLLSPQPRSVQPETILDLQRALPALQGDLFYRALRPELMEFFPEAARNPPILAIERDMVAEAMALNLGEALYAHRMERGIELAQLAQRLGVSDNTLKNYESISVQIENPEVLRRAAEILAVDPRVVYLHYHPQILRLFRLKPRPMDEAEYRYWTRERAAMRDPGNLRERLYAAAREAGVAGPEALAERLAIAPGLARKYWQKIHPLTVEEIRRLTEAFPVLSYREWYEHFQGHALAHFLGRRMDGEFDYSLPEGWNLERLRAWDLRSEIRNAVAARYASPRAAAEAVGVGFLARSENLARSLKEMSWTNDTIARIARGLGLDRRLLFLYFRGAELEPMLGGRP
ncbi:MAG: helix-turn-helix transcriptional regulator [Deltaproteobacteria bacterium]|nr:helix-turn-helix transcriptional regulator [Deltaproteobacteria bacterium]